MVTGAVDKRASRDPKGATMAEPVTVTKCTELNPLSASNSAQAPMRPRWPACRRPIKATPCARTSVVASSISL